MLLRVLFFRFRRCTQLASARTNYAYRRYLVLYAENPSSALMTCATSQKRSPQRANAWICGAWTRGITWGRRANQNVCNAGRDAENGSYKNAALFFFFLSRTHRTIITLGSPSGAHLDAISRGKITKTAAPSSRPSRRRRQPSIVSTTTTTAPRTTTTTHHPSSGVRARFPLAGGGVARWTHRRSSVRGRPSSAHDLRVVRYLWWTVTRHKSSSSSSLATSVLRSAAALQRGDGCRPTRFSDRVCKRLCSRCRRKKKKVSKKNVLYDLTRPVRSSRKAGRSDPAEATRIPKTEMNFSWSPLESDIPAFSIISS